MHHMAIIANEPTSSHTTVCARHTNSLEQIRKHFNAAVNNSSQNISFYSTIFANTLYYSNISSRTQLPHHPFPQANSVVPTHVPFESFGHTAELVAEARRLCAVAEVNQHCFGQLLSEQQANEAAHSASLDETRSMIVQSDEAEKSVNIEHAGANALDKAHATVTQPDAMIGSAVAFDARDTVPVLSGDENRGKQSSVETHGAVTSLHTAYGGAASTDLRHQNSFPLAETNNAVTPLGTANEEEMPYGVRHKTSISSAMPHEQPTPFYETHAAVTASDTKHEEDIVWDIKPDPFPDLNAANGAAVPLAATHEAVTTSNAIHGDADAGLVDVSRARMLLVPTEEAAISLAATTGAVTSLNSAHRVEMDSGQSAPLEAAHRAGVSSHMTPEEATALLTMPPTIAEVQFFTFMSTPTPIIANATITTILQSSLPSLLSPP